nr:hypothetical protein [Tanacetum cinerariifolium]
MTTLTDKAILSGADNHSPMLEKDMYDSWKSRMELYMMNRHHERIILESIENEAVQADCDVKATNIILQGLPPESKFVTDVKPVRDLHTTNVDQLHAYLGQHEFHANESSTPLLITYPSNDFQSLVHHNVYTPSSSISQVEYPPFVNQQPDFSQPYSGLIVPVFQKGDDPIDAINHMMSFLTAVVTSRYPSTNNQLRNSANSRQQATINNGRVTVQPIQGRHTSLAAGTSRTYTSGASGNNSRKQRTVICYNYKGEGHMSKQCTKPMRKRDESWFKDKKLKPHRMSSPTMLLIKPMIWMHMTLIVMKSTLPKLYSWGIYLTMFKMILLRQALGFQNPFYLKKAQQLEPKLYDGNVIQKTKATVIRDSKETLMLAEESHSKMLLKQKDLMMSEKKVNTKPVDYANSVSFEEPNPSTRPTQVEVPKELPTVSMVNTSLKKLKHHLASFDVAVEQHRVESKTFQVKINKVLNENERLLKQVISKDAVNIVVTSSVNNAYEPVYECERCVKLETELQKDFIKRELYDKLFKRYTTLEKHSLKDNLRKLKGKAIVDEAVILLPMDPEFPKVDVAPLSPKLRNNRTAHSDYLKHTQEETATLREIVKHERSLNPLNTSLDYAYKYTK